MKVLYRKLIACFFAGTLLTGCASSYNAIRPETIQYSAKSESDGVVLQYRYNVLTEHNNKKYAKKEIQNGMQLVAVKLTNNSDRVVNVPEDINLFAGENKLTPAPPTLVHSTLKQGVPIYLLYLLFTPIQLTTTSSVSGQTPQTNSFPIGVILGPGLTAFNMLRAGNANQTLLKDLQTYNLMNKQLQPGETTYALIGIRNSGYSPLLIKAVTDNGQAKQ